jgi:two-component system nitrogen regulation sensor histidine kinase NtrY
MRLNTLRHRLALALLVTALLGAVLHAGVSAWLAPGSATGRTGWLMVSVLAAGALAGGLAAWSAAARLLRPLNRLARAIEGTAMSFRDGDFSTSMVVHGDDEVARIAHQLNALGQALRQQNQQLVQRELLLDAVVENTPLALVLTDGQGRVAHANPAARQLLYQGRSLQGADFSAVLQDAPEALRQAIAGSGDALLSVTIDGQEETFHLQQRQFHLLGRPHRLHVLRRMTRELSRQEVASWKRVISVVSHELNNSLAPISSLAHSAGELAQRGDTARLPAALAAIGERVRHLHRFLEGYARFAKLPVPRLEPVEWPAFLDRLGAQCRFSVTGTVPAQPGKFDAAQLEQALINLLKNAREAAGEDGEVMLSVVHQLGELRFEVCDSGSGMSETVLAQALLPFYSTKRTGMGLGLALAREIAEAHGGRIALQNRAEGGLRVTLTVAAHPAKQF